MARWLAVWLTLLAVALSPRDAAARPPLVRLPASPVDGLEVRDSRIAPWRPAPGGLTLGTGAELRVRGAEVTVLLRGGSSARLAPGTHAVFYRPLEIELRRGDRVRAPRIDLREGAAEVLVPPVGRASAAVLLAGQEATFAAVRPGRARVRATRTGMVVGVEAGAARVAANGAWAEVAAGEVVVLDGSRMPPRSRPLPDAPTWSLSTGDPRFSPLALALGAPRAEVGVAWSGSPGATGYELEIAKEPRFADPFVRVALGSEARGFRTAPLPPGRYLARLRAVGREGVLGLPSAPRELRVVALEPPVGAVVDREARLVVMHPRRALRLLQPAGLEISVDGGAFRRAASELRLHGAEERRLALRMAGDPVSTPLTLERRALAVEIELSPRNARWPDDAVAIRVALRDPRGRVDVSRLRPVLTVTVNAEPVTLLWSREDGEWRARLAPRPAPGPWVVRIEAADTDGATLGREFLEITGPPTPHGWRTGG